MNSKKVLFLLSLSLLSSCGGFEKEKSHLRVQNEKKDLVNSFNLNKDQAELFKEKVVKESDEKPMVTKVIDLKTGDLKVAKTKKNKDKKLITKGESAASPTNSPPPVTASAPTSVVTPPPEASPTIVPPAEFVYPADYPQGLKDYDAVSKVIWEKFKPMFFQGEESIMSISYLGVTAGYITISSKNIVRINDKQAYHYFARFKSKDIYNYFYWLDDSIETFIEKSTFLPMKYSLIQREKKQNVDDLELFDFKKLKTYHWYKRVKQGSNRDEKIETYIPRFSQDSFSALQFVRGLPLHKGDLYDFPVVTRGKPWLLKVEVMDEEIVSINGTDIKAYRLRAETHLPGVLQKSGDINFWYSADETRRLLKFQAKVKIGSIYGELVEYRPGVLIK